MTEQLGLEEVLRQRAAAQRDEGAVLALAEGMDRLGDALLAGARLPLDLHGRLRRRDGAHALEDLVHRVGGTDDAVEGPGLTGVQLLAQAAILLGEVRDLPEGLQPPNDRLVAERLLDVVHGPLRIAATASSTDA